MNQWRTCGCMLGALLLTGCTAAGAAEHAASHGTAPSVTISARPAATITLVAIVP